MLIYLLYYVCCKYCIIYFFYLFLFICLNIYFFVYIYRFDSPNHRLTIAFHLKIYRREISHWKMIPPLHLHTLLIILSKHMEMPNAESQCENKLSSFDEKSSSLRKLFYIIAKLAVLVILTFSPEFHPVLG